MYNWKPKKNGIEPFTQYMRYQDDFFHKQKLINIRKRSNKFIFPSIVKPKTSYQSKKSPNHSHNVIASSLDKNYNISKDNAYLGNKLIQISTRPKQPLNDYFLMMSEKRIKFNQFVRTMEKERVNRENLFFKSRLMNTPSIINHKKLDKEFSETRSMTMHLRKIEPMSSIDGEKEEFYSKTLN